MTALKYSVDLCDSAWSKLGEASAFTFQGVQSFNAPGAWTLDAERAGLEVPLIDDVSSVIVWEDRSGGRRIVFAGRVQPSTADPGGRLQELTADGTTVRLSGLDLFGVLNGRSTWPTPSTAPPWPDSHDENTGPGSTVAAAYIADNFGSNAIADRQVPNVTIVDPDVGDSGTWTARLVPLGDFVGKVCRESGIGCHVAMTTPGEWTISFDSPNDLSGSLVFTDQGDLESLSRLITPAKATHVIAAGQGELTARMFATADSGATGIDRVEIVHESVNTTTATGLTRTANTQLALNAEDVAVEAVLSDSAAQKIAFGDQYRLGDWLGVELDGVRYRSQVEAVTFDISPDRSLITPALGRATADELVSLVRSVSDLTARFDTQIR